MPKYVITKPANNRKDLTGQRFGKLVALNYYASEITQVMSDGKVKLKACWLLKCDCGNSYVARANDLVDGKVKSCSCHKRIITAEFNTRTKTKETHYNVSRIWQGYKRGSKDRGLSFEISKEDFLEYTQMNCHYCGKKPANISKPVIKGKKAGFIYNGLDRKDPDMGYSKENCVPCCWQCNRMKARLQYNDFIKIIKNIYDHTYNQQLSLI
jgi:hypothetical protein